MVDTRQLDLYAGAQLRPASAVTSAHASRRSLGRRRGVLEPDPERAAQLLSEHEDYRILRRLKPRELLPPRPLAPGEQLAVIVDTETTGLDHAHDEIIEIGMVAFVHDAHGAILDLTGVFSALQEPSRPIGPEIARLTGITAAMVEGQAIDITAVERFIEEADLIIAHNAGFDRPFCERLVRGFARNRGRVRSRKSIGPPSASRVASSAISSDSVGGFTMGIARSTIATRCLKCWRIRCRTTAARGFSTS